MTNLTFPLFASVLTAALVGGVSAESRLTPKPADIVSGFSQAIPPEQPVVGELHQHGNAGASCCCGSMHAQAAAAKPSSGSCCGSMKAASKATSAPASKQGGCCKKGDASNNARK